MVFVVTAFQILQLFQRILEKNIYLPTFVFYETTEYAGEEY